MHWPSSMRLAFVVGVCALASGFLYLGLQFGSEVPAGAVITRVSAWFGFLAPLWNLIAALGNASDPFMPLFLEKVQLSGKLQASKFRR